MRWLIWWCVSFEMDCWEIWWLCYSSLFKFYLWSRISLGSVTPNATLYSSLSNPLCIVLEIRQNRRLSWGISNCCPHHRSLSQHDQSLLFLLLIINTYLIAVLLRFGSACSTCRGWASSSHIQPTVSSCLLNERNDSPVTKFGVSHAELVSCCSQYRSLPQHHQSLLFSL